jgi:thiol peroxidase
MSVERSNAVTLKGQPLTLVGPELKAGDQAPDFQVLGTNLKPLTLADTEGKVRIFSVVPSLDTPLCDTQTRRFNKEASELKGAKIYAVSMDLPFAQSRWATFAGVGKLVMLSDHKDASFGENYGTLIKEMRLDTRAIFVVDEDGIVRYAEYVGEIGDHPDYEAVLNSAKELLGA